MQLCLNSFSRFAGALHAGLNLIRISHFSLHPQNLAHNRLQALPNDLGRSLPALKRLLLDSNALEALPDSLSCLVQLTELELANNALTALPDLQPLSLLSRLDLRHNKLATVPQLTHMSGLRELYMGHNALKALGDIGALCPAALTTLDVRDNRIKQLPPSITQLLQLERLELANNDLTELPPQLGLLPKIKVLGLEGNPLRSLRGSGILSRGTQAILKYLRCVKELKH